MASVARPTTAPIASIAIAPIATSSLGMTHYLRLAHDHDLNLAGKSQLGLDSLGYVECQHLGVLIPDLFATNHDADLATGVDGVHVCDARKRSRDFF